MASSFDELLATIKEYHFVVYVIPGYTYVFRNRNEISRGGVGTYLRDGISYKRRIDIENIAQI
ncbi:hypothetical protein pdam_00013576, partial [Pocillopora damicornis]